MFIQSEITPNPETLKFIPGEPVLDKGTAQFNSKESAQHSPLARRVMAVDGVKAVFLGKDFVSVTKQESLSWDVVKPLVLGAIMDHYTSGEPVILEKKEDAASETATDDPISQQIKELIETRIRPAVAMDGGDITFQKFEDGIVYLQMKGACSGCPSSTITLKSGIENMLRYYVPEVLEVRPVEEEE